MQFTEQNKDTFKQSMDKIDRAIEKIKLLNKIINTRTYDVRIKRTDLGIDENIKLDKTYPY